MAEQLDSYNFPHGGRTLSPWDQWLDGSVWRLTAGEDFEGTPSGKQQGAYLAAQKRGLRVHTAIEGECLIIQAYRPDGAVS